MGTSNIMRFYKSKYKMLHLSRGKPNTNTTCGMKGFSAALLEVTAGDKSHAIMVNKPRLLGVTASHLYNQ